MQSVTEDRNQEEGLASILKEVLENGNVEKSSWMKYILGKSNKFRLPFSLENCTCASKELTSSLPSEYKTGFDNRFQNLKDDCNSDHVKS